jgi:squalene synthase HpnC
MPIVAIPESNAEALLAAGWSHLPASYRPPAIPPTLAESQAWCRHLAETHYENFHVASRFLPEKYRAHFHAIYAYCRVADDLGDETGNREESLALLDYWQQQLDACYAGHAHHPVFVALAATIEACHIPQRPFNDLLVAFRRDQDIHRFATMAEVLDYCHYSANPVGHLVLYIWGHSDAERQHLSDYTCSALQLANFWQDVREDYARGRIYIPQDLMQQFGVEESVIADAQITPQFHELMRHLVAEARAMFAEGKPLLHRVSKDLAVDLDLFTRGGLEILNAIEAQGYDVLRARPSISKGRKAMLLLSALKSRVFGVAS